MVESFSIRWVDIKAYLSYKDTVKTDFEIRGILAQSVAIITPCREWLLVMGLIYMRHACAENLYSGVLCILDILLLESILVVYFRVYLAHGYQSASLDYITLYRTTDFLRMIIGLYY